MAQSPEYPDLLWMPPKSWTDANRSSVQLIVIHTTEGSEGPVSAEDGASYDQRRTDGTSTHYFHDANSTVQCVRTTDQAHAARAQGNRRGIQHELCGRAGQGAAGWADTISQGTLRHAAKQAARDAKKWGIPVRHLSVAQVVAGEKGFCGHVDVTKAFPQDKGTHTDPGPDFPWSQFLDMVRAELAPASKPAAQEDDMPTPAEYAQAVASKLHVDLTNKASGLYLDVAASEARVGAALKAHVDTLGKSLNAAIGALGAKGAVDVKALAAELVPGVTAGVLAGLPADRDDVTPAELQDAIVGALKVLVDRPTDS